MCHYHSISVNRRGTIAHTASNSHSEAVEEAEWKENTAQRAYHWDFEYDPNDGDYPGALECMTGEGYVGKPTQRVLDSVDAHYQRLAALHGGDYSLLKYFSENNYGDVRKIIAGGIFTPPAILAQLADDEDVTVRREVVSNPSTPPSVLAQLSGDKDGEVHLAAASNPSTPPEILAQLAGDEDVTVREKVVSNPSTPLSALAQLSGDKDRRVRLTVASNPSTPPGILHGWR